MLDDSPRVRLSTGEVLSADHVVLAAGVGNTLLVPNLPVDRLRCLRRVLWWIETPQALRASLAQLPVYGAFTPHGFFYGFPHNDEGISGLKVACHTSSAIPDLDDPIDPRAVVRDRRRRDWTPIASFLAQHFPSAGTKIAGHKVCMYTATPSWDFLIDRHPECDRVVIVGGLSGHGFKFAPSLGTLVANLVCDEAPPRAEFSWDRLCSS